MTLFLSTSAYNLVNSALMMFILNTLPSPVNNKYTKQSPLHVASRNIVLFGVGII